MPIGFLAVGTTPGPNLTLEEFHDWYDREHIPLRLEHLPSFLSGARFHAVDLDGVPDGEQTEKPRWLAVYDIDDPSTFKKPEYTSLREKRSQREAGVMARMGILTRICTVDVGEWTNKAIGVKTTGLKLPSPTRWLVTYALDTPIDPGSDAAKQSVDEVTKRFELGYASWIRSRLFNVLESGVTGVWATGSEEILPFWVMHEFDSPNEAKAAAKVIQEIGEAGGSVVREVRVWQLYKAYRSLSQRDEEAHS